MANQLFQSFSASLDITGLAAATTVDMANDLLPIYSNAASANRKMTVNNVLAGVRPAFIASRTAAQTIAGSSDVKVQFNNEELDTNNNYDPVTNYRFTPTVAGIYYLATCVHIDAAVSGNTVSVAIKKNGTIIAVQQIHTSTTSALGCNVSKLDQANGSTDYYEVYIVQTNGSQTTTANTGYVNFCGMRLV